MTVPMVPYFLSKELILYAFVILKYHTFKTVT